MVFTTCIYNNIGYGDKMPHYTDNNSYNFIIKFTLYFSWDLSLQVIKMMKNKYI